MHQRCSRPYTGTDADSKEYTHKKTGEKERESIRLLLLPRRPFPLVPSFPLPDFLFTHLESSREEEVNNRKKKTSARTQRKVSRLLSVEASITLKKQKSLRRVLRPYCLWSDAVFDALIGILGTLRHSVRCTGIDGQNRRSSLHSDLKRRGAGKLFLHSFYRRLRAEVCPSRLSFFRSLSLPHRNGKGSSESKPSLYAFAPTAGEFFGEERERESSLSTEKGHSGPRPLAEETEGALGASR